MSKIEKFKKNKHLISFLDNSINEKEEILDILDGFIGKMMGEGKETQHNGLLFCTNQKVSFHRKGFLSNVSRSIPIKMVSSIDCDEGIINNTIVIHTSNDKISFECRDTMDDVKNFVIQVEKIK